MELFIRAECVRSRGSWAPIKLRHVGTGPLFSILQALAERTASQRVGPSVEQSVARVAHTTFPVGRRHRKERRTLSSAGSIWETLLSRQTRSEAVGGRNGGAAITQKRSLGRSGGDRPRMLLLTQGSTRFWAIGRGGASCGGELRARIKISTAEQGWAEKVGGNTWSTLAKLGSIASFRIHLLSSG